ncbi:cytochrome c oxidase accessory protein CcoG [Pseudoteredinibacter isoporae]|uniref:Cytochrome c oxidase accessory protein FixG n=1 Tax=Pseudoteredinibacter isoporae TaxID=570281 RepID=A0A7X0MXK1_9GAMM|nr:cytochrome c oxidase accessory protein FixG [Pseudoteredinibacter isoporae]NHO89057.1 cytochrome c oxidase accessory protein CcoG [Pseudoteredinibacter isoporae]NIB22332.1 cytochrome c oxidase accessory protein CcoG [Pseudoteredinibacter isoporae]
MTDKIPTTEVDSKPQKQYIDLYAGSNKIYTRKVKGFYQRLRRYTGIPLLLGFLLLPWFNIEGRQAVLFDLPERKFHILWTTFWPQDFMLLAWLLIIAAFALFTVTVLVGRVWCGFTCPQTVWTLMYIWAEDKCEGDRNARIKLDKAPWSFEKIRKKASKHGLWLLIAFVTGFTFIGYFYGARDLIVDLFTFNAHPAGVFWVFFFTAATYGNAGFLREQVCKYMCPYARFQSVMYDRDTMLVTYDEARGETRGKRKAREDYKSKGLGDCIDCGWCVQVCPVDIDIRDGLQYECIDCGLCVDACDSVMDRMKYPRGLIRFTTQDALETGETHVLRPRFIGYVAAVVLMVGLFAYTIGTRTPLGVDVIRDRGAKLFRETPEYIENVYMVKINNMGRGESYFSVNVQADETGSVPSDYRMKKKYRAYLEEGEIFSLPVSVRIDRDKLEASKSTIYFVVEAEDDATVHAIQKASFIGPSKN